MFYTKFCILFSLMRYYNYLYVLGVYFDLFSVYDKEESSFS